MAVSVIVVGVYDPTWLAIFEHVVRSEIRRGREAIVLDTTRVATTPIDTYHRGILRATGLAYPGHDIRERMLAHGARYIAAPALDPLDQQQPLDDRLEELLAVAVGSQLGTLLRTDVPEMNRRGVRRIAEGLYAEGRATYRLVRALVASDPDIDRAFVANGRFPAQKLGTVAFLDAGVHVDNVEIGERPGRAYVQGYGPHERVRSQAAVDEVLADVSEEQIESIAEHWLDRRAPGSTAGNQFSTLWNHGLPQQIAAAQRDGRRIAGIFTSSADEFSFLGPEWQTQEWSDQFHGFDAIIARFEAKGYACYLRVHPNLAGKSTAAFRRERDGVRWLASRHPDLVVLWHDDAANSYALIEASDAVVVWLSTVGLEASARGHSVWTMATSRYGMVADVRQVLSSTELAADDLEPWAVDTRGAKRFLAYLDQRDEDMLPAPSWLPWDPKRPPRRARLARVAVSGGTPGVGRAVRSLLDVYLHRSVRSNVRALRRR